MSQNPYVLTVSQLNSRIAGMIAAAPDLRTVFIEGELSNLRPNQYSGHLYFSLKDSKSVVHAVMFAYNVKNLRFRPEDGMKVILRAQVTVYEPMGQYQLRVEDMQPDGVGKLALQLEQLKKKLDAQGLFDPAHKQKLPAMPRTVGVITSPTGAALRDILDILGRRYPFAKVVLAPVLVQGEGAPAQLIHAVKTFSDLNAADLLIIGRGGGSMEDLWAFNDEGLARAIYSCKIPVISAVGHETDVTICDFVSDLRAPTPSAAAELAVPDIRQLKENVIKLGRRSHTCVANRVALAQRDIERTQRIARANSPSVILERRGARVESHMLRASNAIHTQFKQDVSAIGELSSKLEALNPMAVLSRGFARLTMDGADIDSVEQLSVGDTVSITMKDGRIKAAVTEKS